MQQQDYSQATSTLGNIPNLNIRFLHQGNPYNCIEYIFYSYKTVLNIYFIQAQSSGFWTTCAFPEKHTLPRKFSLRWNIFYLSGFLRNFALALKTKFVMKFLTVFKILFTFRMFEQLVLALKNRVCPEFTVLNIYLLSFRILNNLRLP